MSTRGSDLALVWRWMRFAWSAIPGRLALIITLSISNAALVVTFPWLWQYLVDALQADSGQPRIEELAMWMAMVHKTYWWARPAIRSLAMKPVWPTWFARLMCWERRPYRSFRLAMP